MQGAFRDLDCLSGYNDIHLHLGRNKLNLGVLLRDTCLLQVSDKYVRAVLSLRNLGSLRGTPITIPDSVIEDQHRMFNECALAVDCFHQFVFAIGIDSNKKGDGRNGADVNVSVRKLFRLGKTDAIPRGATGRLSTVRRSFGIA